MKLDFDIRRNTASNITELKKKYGYGYISAYNLLLQGKNVSISWIILS